MDLDHPVETIPAEIEFTQQQEDFRKYICSVCGYVYDPEENDYVEFDELSWDWKCPRCLQGKDKFTPA